MCESVENNDYSDDENTTREPDFETLDDSKDIFKSICNRYLSRVHSVSDPPVKDTSVVDQAFYKLNSVAEPKSNVDNILKDRLSIVLENVTLDETNDDDSSRSNVESSSDNNEDFQSRILAEAVLPPFENKELKRQDAFDIRPEKISRQNALDISNFLQSGDSTEETINPKNEAKFVSKSDSNIDIKSSDRTIFSTSPSGMYNGKPKSFSLEDLHKTDEFKNLREASSIDFYNLNNNYSEMSLFTEGSDSVFLSPVKKNYDKVDECDNGVIVPINIHKRDSVKRSEKPVNDLIRTPPPLKMNLDRDLPVVKAAAILPVAYPEDIKPSLKPYIEIPETIRTEENVKRMKKVNEEKLSFKYARETVMRIIGSNKKGDTKDRTSSSPTRKLEGTEPIATLCKDVKVVKNLITIENSDPRKEFSRLPTERQSYPPRLIKEMELDPPKTDTVSSIPFKSIEAIVEEVDNPPEINLDNNLRKLIGFNRGRRSSCPTIKCKESQFANALPDMIVPNSVNEVNVTDVSKKPLPTKKQPEETTYSLDGKIITVNSPEQDEETETENHDISHEVKDTNEPEATLESPNNVVTNVPPTETDSETLISENIDTSKAHELPPREVCNVKNMNLEESVNTMVADSQLIYNKVRKAENSMDVKICDDSIKLVDVAISEKNYKDNIDNPEVSNVTENFEDNLKVISDDTISKCSNNNIFLDPIDSSSHSTKPKASETPFDVSYHLKINTVNDLVCQDVPKVAISKQNNEGISAVPNTQERVRNFLPIQIISGTYLNKTDKTPSPIIISPVLIQPIFFKQNSTSLETERNPESRRANVYYDDIDQVKSTEKNVLDLPKVDEKKNRGHYQINIKGKNLPFLSWKTFDSNESLADSKRPSESPKPKVVKVTKTPEFFIDNHYYQPMENVPFVINTRQSFTKPIILQTQVKEVKPPVPRTNSFFPVLQPRRDSEENYYEEIGEPIPPFQKPGDNVADDEKLSNKFRSAQVDFSSVTREEILKVPRRPRRPKKEEKHLSKVEEFATEILKEMDTITNKTVISLSRTPSAKETEKKYSGPVGALVYKLEKNIPQEPVRKLSLQGQKAPQTDVNTGSLPRDRKPYWRTLEHKRLSHPIRSLNDPPPPRPLRKLPMDV